MMPLVTVHVRDAYVVGRGAMQATFFGVYSLADEVDKPELNAGALQRFLGEAIWLPTALLPSEAVRWTPLDDDSATVTLSDRGNTVSLDYHFEQDGRISTITGLRYKESSGHYTLQPWRIQCSDHAIRDGMTIPLSCEVAWINEGRAEPYWRGRLTSVSYRYN
jgi:hypothetical protein